jgi:hypothetical protein
MVNLAAGMSVEAERRARGRVSTREENGGGFSTAHPHTKIGPARTRGAAASMISGGRFSGAQRCEHGHRSVTASTAGSTSPVTGPGRQIGNGPLTSGCSPI